MNYLKRDLILCLRSISSNGISSGDSWRVDGTRLRFRHENPPASIIELQPIQNRAAIEPFVAKL